MSAFTTLRMLSSATALGWLLAANPALAQPAADHSAHATQAAAPSAAPIAAPSADLTEGIITRVDARSGKLTIRHGEITNLGMPPMTMVFALKDPVQAQSLQPGAKVAFRAEDTGGGSLLITHIEAIAQ